MAGPRGITETRAMLARFFIRGGFRDYTGNIKEIHFAAR